MDMEDLRNKLSNVIRELIEECMLIKDFRIFYPCAEDIHIFVDEVCCDLVYVAVDFILPYLTPSSYNKAEWTCS